MSPRDALVLTVTAAMLAGAGILIPRFRIEPDLAKMLPADHPLVRLSARLAETSENRRSLFVVLRGTMTDATVAAVARELAGSPHLATVAATRTELLGRVWADRVAAPLWHLPPDQVRALAEHLQPEGRRAALQETLEILAEDPIGGREVAARDPLGLRWLLAGAVDVRLPIRLRQGSRFAIFADGQGALLRIVGKDTALNPEFANALLRDVEARLARTGFGYDLFGGYVIARNDAARIRRDLVFSVLGSAVLVSLYLLFCMRNHAHALIALVPVGLAAFCAMSIGGFLFGPLTPIAIAGAAVLLGLGVDFSIHYLVRFQALRGEHGIDGAIRHTEAALAAPLAIGMLTTAIAFLSLAAGEFGGLAGFGMVLALGLGLAFAGTLYLLPILLRMAPGRPRPPRHSVIADVLDRIASGAHGRRIAIATVVLGIAAWLVVAVAGLELRADPDTLRPADDPVAGTRTRLEQELGMALLPCFLLLDATIDDDLAAATVGRLRDQGVLVVTAGLRAATPARRALVAEFHQQTRGWLAGTLRDLDEIGFAAAAFRPGLEELQQRLTAAPPAGAGDRITLQDRQWRTVLCYPAPGAMTAAGWRDLESRLHDSFGDGARLYGTPALQRELERMLRADLTKAVGLTALLAFGLVLAVARSVRIGLLALLPTLCGLGVTLATLAVLRVPITLGNFIALPFLLGIAVDDGVHLVSRLRSRRRPGITGVAIVRTSLTTIIAFGSLFTARSPGIASLGWIIALGVSACLLATLLVIPPMWSNRRP